MGAGILYTTGAEAENSAVNSSKESVPPLYKNQSSSLTHSNRAVQTLSIVLGYFLPFTVQGKNNLARQNNLRNVHYMLVLKGLFGGSLKITLQNKNNPQGRK